MRIQYSVFLTLMLLSICSNAMGADVTQQPTLADYSDGEKWVWKYRGVTKSGEVRANGKDTKRIISKNGKLFMVTASRTFPLNEIVKPDNGKSSRYYWPLQVGKKWTYEEHWESEDGTKGSTIQDAEVLSYKAETVEAGTFMAYTIQYKGQIKNTRGYSANVEDIHIYAPELKTFIKLTQEQDDYLYIEELIEYSQ